MKSRVLAALVGTTVALAGLGSCAKSNRAEKAASNYNNAQQIQAIAGEVLVKTREKDALKVLDGAYQVTPVDAEDGVYLVRGEAVNGNEDSLVERLQASGKFSVVERNLRRKVNAVPRDPKWLEMWSLKNYGQDSPGGTEGVAGADIGALEAWQTSKGSKQIVVGIIDTGIDYTHPDLQGNMWVNEAEKNGLPGVDDDGNGYADDVYGWDFVSFARETMYHGQLGDPDPIDDHGHGTHVSGTIGAAGNNGVGITGINWNVSLMALKFLSKDGFGSSVDEYRAIRYALKNGVDVVNASYGGGAPSKLVEDALREAGERGMLFVAAAGNDSGNNDEGGHYPSNYQLDNVFSVAATDNRDELAWFSNYGFRTVHIAAPGVAITSTYPLALAESEGTAGNPYRSWSGTSMATPHVVGAAALVMAASPELKGNPVEVKRRLMAAVDYQAHLAGKVASGGRLNLARAVSGQRGTSPIAEQGWIEEAYELVTPRHPTERLDKTWAITKPGAKAIQVHVRKSILDEGYDVGLLFDQLFRPITQLSSFGADYWLPVVAGDTAFLKFSTSIVQVQRFKGNQETANPEELFQQGLSSLCWQDSTTTPGMWTCAVFHEPSQPFANFDSEGIEIDRIRYLPGEQGK